MWRCRRNVGGGFELIQLRLRRVEISGGSWVAGLGRGSLVWAGAVRFGCGHSADSGVGATAGCAVRSFPAPAETSNRLFRTLWRCWSTSGSGVPARCLLGCMLHAVAPLSEALEPLRRISPWYWAMGNDPLRDGFSAVGSIVLLGLTAVCVALGVIMVERRSIRSA